MVAQEGRPDRQKQRPGHDSENQRGYGDDPVKGPQPGERIRDAVNTGRDRLQDRFDQVARLQQIGDQAHDGQDQDEVAARQPDPDHVGGSELQQHPPL